MANKRQKKSNRKRFKRLNEYSNGGSTTGTGLTNRNNPANRRTMGNTQNQNLWFSSESNNQTANTTQDSNISKNQALGAIGTAGSAGSAMLESNKSPEEKKYGDQTATWSQQAVSSAGPWGAAISGVSRGLESALESGYNRTDSGTVSNEGYYKFSESLKSGAIDPARNLEALGDDRFTPWEKVGSIALPGLQGLFEAKYNQRDARNKSIRNRKANYTDNPYGTFRKGGHIKYNDGGQFNPNSKKLTKFKGPPHEEGGIKLDTDKDKNPDIEVEGEETAYKGYIFSNDKKDMKIPKLNNIPKHWYGKTPAKVSEKVIKKYKDKPETKYRKNAKEREMNKLMRLNEILRVKSQEEQETSKFEKGGDSKWMQKANKRMEKKGTKGSFTQWCKNQGYNGVTSGCIEEGLNKGGKIAKKAQFAKAARSTKKRLGGLIDTNQLTKFRGGGKVRKYDNGGGPFGPERIKRGETEEREEIKEPIPTLSADPITNEPASVDVNFVENKEDKKEDKNKSPLLTDTSAIGLGSAAAQTGLTLSEYFINKNKYPNEEFMSKELGESTSTLEDSVSDIARGKETNRSQLRLDYNAMKDKIRDSATSPSIERANLQSAQRNLQRGITQSGLKYDKAEAQAKQALAQNQRQINQAVAQDKIRVRNANQKDLANLFTQLGQNVSDITQQVFDAKTRKDQVKYLNQTVPNYKFNYENGQLVAEFIGQNQESKTED